MLYDELIGQLGDEELDRDATIRRGGDRFQQRFVRDEVGAGEGEAVLRSMHQGGEESEIGDRQVSRPGRKQLHCLLTDTVVLRRNDLLQQALTGLGVPVEGEHRVQRGDDLAAQRPAVPRDRPAR